MLGIPPEQDWDAYCLDEAVFWLHAGHQTRDRAWEDRFRRDEGDGDDLYSKTMRDPRTGKPPSRADLAALQYAQGGEPV